MGRMEKGETLLPTTFPTLGVRDRRSGQAAASASGRIGDGRPDRKHRASQSDAGFLNRPVPEAEPQKNCLPRLTHPMGTTTDSIPLQSSGPSPRTPPRQSRDTNFSTAFPAVPPGCPVRRTKRYNATIANLEPYKNYYIQVRAQNGTDAGAWSETGEGTTAFYEGTLTARSRSPGATTGYLGYRRDQSPEKRVGGSTALETLSPTPASAASIVARSRLARVPPRPARGPYGPSRRYETINQHRTPERAAAWK